MEARLLRPLQHTAVLPCRRRPTAGRIAGDGDGTEPIIAFFNGFVDKGEGGGGRTFYMFIFGGINGISLGGY